MRGLEVIRALVTLARNKGYEQIEGGGDQCGS